MPELKRMTRTSTAVKNRYNKKTYAVISIRVPKAMAEVFKKKCIAKRIPQAQIFKQAIEEFLND